ncbi:hypothetical protein EBQ91_03240 [bacterium]|nr:hypothetical protein [bacterium]
MALIGKVQRGQPITADMMNNIIDSIRECQLQSVVGGVFKRGVGGTTITVKAGRPQGEATLCPFTPIASAVTSGYEVTFQAGTINGVLPSNMLGKLTNVTTSSNNYFYLKCTTDGKVIISSVLEKDTTLRTPVQPTADTAPTEFNIMVGYMTTAGITERTISCGHLQARIAPSLQEDADEYVAGERNYTQFYNWVF